MANELFKKPDENKATDDKEAAKKPAPTTEKQGEKATADNVNPNQKDSEKQKEAEDAVKEQHDNPETEVIEPNPVEDTPEVEEEDTAGEEEAAKADEFSMLKMRARTMGIQFSNNIGLDALREKVKEKLEGSKKNEPAASPNDQPNEDVRAAKKEKTKTLRQHMYDENMKLVRLRITNMDPKKKDLHGEIFTVANESLGVVKKFVPYGEATDDGYHVPYCIYKQLRDRKFLQIRTRRDKRTGQEHVERQYVKEFALEVLPPLTQDELNRLATAQLAAGSTE